MPRIRNICAKNYRTLKAFSWNPSPGLNCIIGHGDSGKSTILDVIDIALGLRRNITFSDSDFFQSNTSEPIEIWVTVGDLPDELKTLDAYGQFLRGFDQDSGTICDEPVVGSETVLTIKVTVTSDLDADWRLYSDRAEQNGIERRLAWKHRELLSAAKLGAASQYHLSWGNRSVLNRFSEQSLDVSSVFAEISRKARVAFSEEQPEGVATVLNSVKGIAASLGVQLGDLKAQLDSKGISLSAGAISLHDEDDTPLRQLGTGSTRLLISGLHKSASDAGILIVDEAEYGLEPYRISRLLNELGSKAVVPENQVFITTHSPYVLRELRADQLCVLRPADSGSEWSHSVRMPGAGNSDQATLRACSEAFLSRRVVVCEGKTEIGLVRGIDQFYQDSGYASMSENGAFCTDGAGDNLFARAGVFASLGYPVAVFKDSDKAADHLLPTQALLSAGIPIHEWGADYSIEDSLFAHCPARLVPALLNIAVERKGYDSVNSTIVSESGGEYSVDECLSNFGDTMRLVLARSAKSRSWYKDIAPGERIGREIVGPSLADFPEGFSKVINGIFQFSHAQV